MRNDIISEVKKQKEVVICGDFQLNSPGWSATKGTYTFIVKRSLIWNLETNKRKNIGSFIYDVRKKVKISPHIHEHPILVCPTLL